MLNLWWREYAIIFGTQVEKWLFLPHKKDLSECFGNHPYSDFWDQEKHLPNYIVLLSANTTLSKSRAVFWFLKQ